MAYAGDFLSLRERPAKPRERGLTHMIDKGLTPAQVDDLLSTAGDYVDIAKLGWGTGYVTPNLRVKLEVYRAHGVPVCFGGTLTEIAIAQRRFDEFRRFCSRLGMTHVEISDGTVSMPHHRKCDRIATLAEDFVVLSEVGSKAADAETDPAEWHRQIVAELDAGSWKVITEARESGTTGMFDASGRVDGDAVEEVVAGLPLDRLLFEAPQKSQQAWFISRFGPDVNLGNIEPSELIPLETLRLGLRSDTLVDLLLGPAADPSDPVGGES